MKIFILLSFLITTLTPTSFAQTLDPKTAKVIWVDGKPQFEVQFDDGEEYTYSSQSQWSQWDINPTIHFLAYYIGWNVALVLTTYFKAPILYQFIKTGGGALVLYIGFIDAIRVGRSIYHKLAPHQGVDHEVLGR